MTKYPRKVPNLMHLVREGVKLKPHDKWPTFDGKNLNRSDYVTASEVGNCMRQIYFDKTVPTVNAYEVGKGWGYFERGHSVERWVVEQILRKLAHDMDDAKYDVYYLGDAQVSFHHAYQSGTPDGMIVRKVDGVSWVLDIKSIDPRTNVRFLPKPNNVLQVQQNIDLVRECLEGYDVVGGILLYVDASNFELMHQFDFPFDAELAAQLESKAHRIMTAVNAESLPPEGLSMKDGCKYCGHTAACSGFMANVEKDNNVLLEAERAIENVFRQS